MAAGSARGSALIRPYLTLMTLPSSTTAVELGGLTARDLELIAAVDSVRVLERARTQAAEVGLGNGRRGRLPHLGAGQGIVAPAEQVGQAVTGGRGGLTRRSRAHEIQSCAARPITAAAPEPPARSRMLMNSLPPSGRVLRSHRGLPSVFPVNALLLSFLLAGAPSPDAAGAVPCAECVTWEVTRAQGEHLAAVEGSLQGLELLIRPATGDSESRGPVERVVRPRGQRRPRREPNA